MRWFTEDELRQIFGPDPKPVKYSYVLEKKPCKHTKCPESYWAWFEWASKKRRTHKQTKCPSCGLYAVWVPKEGE